MKYLLDTCVLSELRHPKGRRTVREVVERIPDPDLFLSVLTVGEIARGVSLLAEGQKRRELEAWLGVLRQSYAGRILPIDEDSAVLWGRMSAEARQKGTPLPAVDGLIATTAAARGRTVITRNARHFQVVGVAVLDPWETMQAG